MSNWILNNISLKVGAILASVLLWLHVVTERKAYESVDVPIRFQSISDSLIVVDVSDSTVTFQLETKIKQLILLNLFGHPYMDVDLDDVKKGENRIELSKDWIVLPSWRPLNVDRIIVPSEITVKTELQDRKKVPVNAILEGSLQEGYFVKTVETNPDSITLIGGKNSLETIKEVNLEPVDVEGKTGSFSSRKRVVVPEGGFKALQTEVKVNIVCEKFVTRTFSDIKVILKDKENYSVIPASIDVTVAGPENIVKNINSSRIKAYVDSKGKRENIIPYFNLPDGIVFKSCNPRRVEIRKIGE
jgi:YbbR domain-containing protein